MSVKNMYLKCRSYDPRPIHELTDAKAKAFSMRLAEDAKKTMSLSRDETFAYANAIYSSIQYYNKRSQAHQSHVRYLNELEMLKREKEELRKKDELQKKRIQIIIIK